MWKAIKYLFYAYVIILAGFVTYKGLLTRSFGGLKVPFVAPEKKCYQGGKDWKYCVFLTPTTDTTTFLYSFHGRGGDENFWSEGKGYTALLQNVWQKQLAKVPLVITVSFGETWVVSKKMSKDDTGLMERFQNEVFPIIEKSIGRPQQRMLIGNSMGALNALTVALEMPRHFQKVAALCPPLFKISPFDRWHKLMNFAHRTGAHPQSILTIVGLGRRLFVNVDEWLQFNPLEKVKTVSFESRPQFYLTAGTRDEFGLYEGVEAFVLQLQKTRAMTYWHPNTGNHCSVDIKSLANFLEI